MFIKKEKKNKKNSVFNFKKLNTKVHFNKKNISMIIRNNNTFTDFFERLKQKIINN